MSKNSINWIVSLLLTFLLWLIVSAIPGPDKYISTPAAVLYAFLDNGDILWKHSITTFKTASIGFLMGTIIAMFASLIAQLVKRTESFFSLFALTIYSIPLIAAAPLTALIFGASSSGIVLGCIGSFLPIYSSGISYAGRTSFELSNMAQVFGANNSKIVISIKLPLLFRGWNAAAISGWLWAVLGAMLGEFTGEQWGIGTFLTGALGQGDIEKVWAIVCACLLISGLGMLVLKMISILSVADSKNDAIEISSSNLPSEVKKTGLKIQVINAFIIILLWQIASWIWQKDNGIFSSPIDLLSLTGDIWNSNTDVTFSDIFSSLGQTWLIALAGVSISLILAFLFAALQLLLPLASRPLLFVMFITQIIPIVAFVPLIAICAGRTTLAVTVIVILSTIYSAFIIFRKSFEETSKSAVEMATAFGGSKFSIFKKIQIPFAGWMVAVALRLAIGRAILGAVTGEYLITGDALGGLLGASRHQLDFRVVWLICFLVAVSTLIMLLLLNWLTSFLRKSIE